MSKTMDDLEKRSGGKGDGMAARKASVVDDQLVEGEKKLHVCTVHWGIFLSPIFYNVIGVLVMIFFHPLVGGTIIFLALYPTIISIILYFTTYLVLTNKRVFARYGFFNRDQIQVRIDKIESAHLEQPFVGQIFGYDTVIIRGTGTGTIPIPYIDNGKSFVRKLETYTLEGIDPQKEVEDKEQDEAE